MLSPGTLLRASRAPSLSAVSLVNDYFDDASGLDADSEFAKNPFPLGSRVTQSGALSKRGVVVFAALCAGLALASPADPKRMTAAFASFFGLHFTGGILLAGGLLLAQRA